MPNHVVSEDYITTPIATRPLPVPAKRRQVNPWLAMTAMAFGLFIALLNVTNINVALPNLQQALHTNLPTVSWVLNAYNLGFAAILIPVGRLADQFGPKRLFMLSMVIFGIGSLLCALTSSIGWLIAFRVLQAAGAAGISAISLAIIAYLFPREQRGMAIGVWGAMTGAAAALGPLQGGFLIQYFDWRWLFLVNLPVCAIGLILVAFLVPERKGQVGLSSLDLPGVLTLTAAISALVLAITEGSAWGWTSMPTLALLVASIVAFMLFISIELRQHAPIINFKLFAIRDFTISNLTIFLFGIAIQGGFLMLILYFSLALGYDSLHTGLVTMTMPAGEITGAIIYSRISKRISPRTTSIASLIILSIAMALLTTLPLNAGFFDIAWRAFCVGLSVGLGYSSLPNLALMDIPLASMGVASGIFNTARQIGLTLGVAILISLFNATQQHNLLIMPAHEATSSAFKLVWWVAGLFALAGLIMVLMTRSSAHNEKLSPT